MSEIQTGSMVLLSVVAFFFWIVSFSQLVTDYEFGVPTHWGHKLVVSSPIGLLVLGALGVFG